MHLQESALPRGVRKNGLVKDILEAPPCQRGALDVLHCPHLARKYLALLERCRFLPCLVQLHHEADIPGMKDELERLP